MGCAAGHGKIYDPGSKVADSAGTSVKAYMALNANVSYPAYTCILVVFKEFQNSLGQDLPSVL